MNNNVLIIGNGFDLYHKLPTRYTDFLFLVRNWEKFYALYTEQLMKSHKMRSEAEHEQFSVSVNEYGKLTEEALEDFANHAICLDNESIWIPKEFTTLEDTPIKVYIMGHSLGMTDKEILKDFFLEKYVSEITIFYHSQYAYEQLVISLIELFGKDFVIEQTGSGRVKFVKLKSAEAK